MANILHFFYRLKLFLLRPLHQRKWEKVLAANDRALKEMLKLPRHNIIINTEHEMAIWRKPW